VTREVSERSGIRNRETESAWLYWGKLKNARSKEDSIINAKEKENGVGKKALQTDKSHA